MLSLYSSLKNLNSLSHILCFGFSSFKRQINNEEHLQVFLFLPVTVQQLDIFKVFTACAATNHLNALRPILVVGKRHMPLCSRFASEGGEAARLLLIS